MEDMRFRGRDAPIFDSSLAVKFSGRPAPPLNHPPPPSSPVGLSVGLRLGTVLLNVGSAVGSQLPDPESGQSASVGLAVGLGVGLTVGTVGRVVALGWLVDGDAVGARVG